MQYFIRIDETDILVTREVYKAYCRGQRKERYFRESDLHNQVCSYDALDTEDHRGCDLFSDPEALPVEEAVQKHLALISLSAALEHLSLEELETIRRIYCYRQSLRQIARDTGTPLTTLSYRHRRILEKLRREMETGEGGGL